MPSTAKENKIVEQTLVNDVIKEFVDSRKIKNFVTIENLLAEKDTIQISVPNFEGVSVSKLEYIIYPPKLIEDKKIDNYSYNQCLYFCAGGRAILYNEGLFSLNDLKNHDKSAKTSFMFALNDVRIQEIKYCNTFLKNHNRPQFEVSADRIKHLMNDNSWDFE